MILFNALDFCLKTQRILCMLIKFSCANAVKYFVRCFCGVSASIQEKDKFLFLTSIDNNNNNKNCQDSAYTEISLPSIDAEILLKLLVLFD